MTILLQRKELLRNVLGNKYGQSLYFHARSFGFLVNVNEEGYEYMFDKDKLEKHILKQSCRHSKIKTKIKTFRKRIKDSPCNVWNPWPTNGYDGKFFITTKKDTTNLVWVDINLFVFLTNRNPLDTRGYQRAFQRTAIPLKEAGVPICPFSKPQLKKVSQIDPIFKRAQKYQKGYERLLKKLRGYTDELW